MDTPAEGDGGSALDRSTFVLEFEEDFRGGTLDPGRWVAHYLPHWTTPERSAARFDLGPAAAAHRRRPAGVAPGGRRDARPEPPDGHVVGAGRVARGPGPAPPRPRGADAAAHAGALHAVRWSGGGRPAREPRPDLHARLLADRLRRGARAVGRALCLRAVRAQDRPRVLGREHRDQGPPRPAAARGRGGALELDAFDWHTCSVAWTPERARFYVDDRLVRSVEQGLDYPQLLLVDLFEFPAGLEREPAAYPRVGEVAAVGGYRHASETGSPSQ